MRKLSRYFISTILLPLILPALMQAQTDPAKLYAANCVLCHAENGSGNSPTGKALHAKDLRSDEVQKQSDTEIAQVIAKGKGKMPAFGTRIHPDGITKLVAYIRQLPNQ